MLRQKAINEEGAHMVTHIAAHLQKALETVFDCATQGGPLECPVCGMAALNPATLWMHLPQFHINHKREIPMQHFRCPICSSQDGSLIPHVFHRHPPPGVEVEEEDRFMPKTVAFALCVIQRKRDKKFLLVQEYSNQGFWLPGGGIDAGEFPVAAARRECLEEAGVNVELTGLLRVDIGQKRGSSIIRMRYIFFGSPKNEDPEGSSKEAKTYPDFESVGACWISIEELEKHVDHILWRGPEPVEWFRYIARGGVVSPISIIDREGAPPPPS
jgi:8-oxo-dGTP pyrophosphatase MutT (NUDIX family)